jgi:hypothetical protein
MKKIENLDTQCEKIFSYLALNMDPITFNKLFEQLQAEMTKPTLIKHLDHLQKNKIVKRERIGKQKVTYKIHPEFLNEFQKGREFLESTERLKKNQETFNSLSLAKRVDNTLTLMIIFEIEKLKNAFQSSLPRPPKESYENNLIFACSRGWLSHLIKFQFLSSIKSETEVKEALKEIERIEKDYWAIVSTNSEKKENNSS